MKILITGGAVHGKLDDVKIITNKFKGGMIADLAFRLAELNKDFDITYLTAKGMSLPNTSSNFNISIVYHDGFYDYYDKVLEYCKTFDAVILGAAIANLIPKTPFPGKFPSHNYKIGEEINIPFIIAPRIITEVKKINPNIKLYGFKLLSNVDHNYLIDIAYDLCLETKADVIFANDIKDIKRKYAVTKEKAIIPFIQSETYSSTDTTFFDFIAESIRDKHYHTKIIDYIETKPLQREEYKKLINKFFKLFVEENKYLFGCLAYKNNPYDFFVSSRGKNDYNEISHVVYVSEKNKEVIANKKASLNAPFLHQIFLKNPDVQYIFHGHNIEKAVELFPEYFIKEFITYNYCFPGTERETRIATENMTSFMIKHHGYYLLFDKNNNLI